MGMSVWIVGSSFRCFVGFLGFDEVGVVVC